MREAGVFVVEIWGIVFGLASILVLAVLMLPVAERTRIPHTVVLAVAGILVGLLIYWLGGDVSVGGALTGEHGGSHEGSASHGGGPIWLQALNAIGSLEITADVILFVFLPALVFESALSLDARKLWNDISPIMFLAAIGVLISTVVIGLTMAAYTGQALVLCLLLGAVVSATDPVAVIALFKDLGAPKRLTILVEGESLFNDATAIVASTILLVVLASPGATSVTDGLVQFFTVFFGGIIVGFVGSWLALWVMEPFRRQALLIVTLSLVVPFLLFVLAEHFLHVSGVMAVVASGLTIGTVGRRLIPPQSFHDIEHSWHQIAFWATSLIFVLVGLAVPQLLGPKIVSYWDEILVIFVAATGVRALIIFGLLPIMSGLGMAQKVSRSFQAIMVWGGLRGAVSLALALIIAESPAVDEQGRAFIGVLVTSFVLMTLLGQATTISPLLAALGLNKLSDRDQAVRDRSLVRALRDVRTKLGGIADTANLDDHQQTEIMDRYQEALQQAESETAATENLSVSDWQRIGIEMALGQERQMYLTKYGEGYVTAARLRETLASVDEVAETLATLPTENTSDALFSSVSYAPNFQNALSMQRRFGWSRPLARSIEERFNILAFKKMVLREQRDTRLAEIIALLPDDAQPGFVEMIEQRIGLVEENHKALCLQYPEYAQVLEQGNLARAGLRLEEIAYDRLHKNQVIGPEIHSDLLHELTAREAQAGRLPRLQLKQDPALLIGRVPFFQNSNMSQHRQISKMLTTRFFAPREKVITAGDEGNCMYFIASGAVRINIKGADLTLGTGDFFGELALVTKQSRNADVTALGFATLLELHKRDFVKLVKRNGTMREEIRKIALERLGNEIQLDI